MRTVIRTVRALALALAGALGAPGGTAAAWAAEPGPAAAPPAEEKLVVVCTLPTLEALVREVGGDQVETVSLAKGDQDPHFVSPTPVLMQKTRRADLFVEVGMSLELWADQVVVGSGNPGISTGTEGRVVASAGISRLEIPAVISREMGDIHPQGNPHMWLDPVRAKRMAGNIERALETKRPALAGAFRERLKSFEDRIDGALYGPELMKAVGVKTLDRLALEGRLQVFLQSNEFGGKKLTELAGGWLRKAAPLRGMKAVEYHKVWVYFSHAFGLDLRGTIEERPGIPPGPQYLNKITQLIRDQGVKLILVDNFYDPALPRKVGEDGGAPVVMLPNQVRGEEGITNYFQLMDYIFDELLKASKVTP